MEKQKTMQQPSRKISNFRMILLFIVATIGAVIVLIILGPIGYGDGTIQQTSLPDELRPTAEAVLGTVPLDRPVELIEGVSIRIDTGAIGENSICFNAGLVREGHNYPQHSRIVVNGITVHGAMNYTPMDYYYFDLTNVLYKCVEGDLEPGLHLIEFHLRDSMWGEPIATQQWAIEIE